MTFMKQLSIFIFIALLVSSCKRSEQHDPIEPVFAELRIIVFAAMGIAKDSGKLPEPGFDLEKAGVSKERDILVTYIPISIDGKIAPLAYYRMKIDNRIAIACFVNDEMHQGLITQETLDKIVNSKTFALSGILKEPQ